MSSQSSSLSLSASASFAFNWLPPYSTLLCSSHTAGPFSRATSNGGNSTGASTRGTHVSVMSLRHSMPGAQAQGVDDKGCDGTSSHSAPGGLTGHHEKLCILVLRRPGLPLWIEEALSRAHVIKAGRTHRVGAPVHLHTASTYKSSITCSF